MTRKGRISVALAAAALVALATERAVPDATAQGSPCSLSMSTPCDLTGGVRVLANKSAPAVLMLQLETKQGTRSFVASRLTIQHIADDLHAALAKQASGE